MTLFEQIPLARRVPTPCAANCQRRSGRRTRSTSSSSPPGPTETPWATPTPPGTLSTGSQHRPPRRPALHRPPMSTPGPLPEPRRPHDEVLLAWQCSRRARAACAAHNRADGKHIAEHIVTTFPPWPIKEIARLGRTLRHLAHLATTVLDAEEHQPYVMCGHAQRISRDCRRRARTPPPRLPRCARRPECAPGGTPR